MSHESTETRLARMEEKLDHLTKILDPMVERVDTHGEFIRDQKRDKKWLLGLVTVMAGAGGHGIHKLLDWFSRVTGN